MSNIKEQNDSSERVLLLISGLGPTRVFKDCRTTEQFALVVDFAAFIGYFKLVGSIADRSVGNWTIAYPPEVRDYAESRLPDAVKRRIEIESGNPTARTVMVLGEIVGMPNMPKECKRAGLKALRTLLELQLHKVEASIANPPERTNPGEPADKYKAFVAEFKKRRLHERDAKRLKR